MWSFGGHRARPWSEAREAEAARAIAALPPYQVALWPDGWEHLEHGGVLVRDTDAMAEARRWYRLAERNHGLRAMGPAMRLHGTFVPRPIVDLSRQRFASAQAASVAVQLVAGDWVAQRRAELLRSPVRALAERAQTWSGSRSGEPLDASALGVVLGDLLAQCIAEGLIPRVAHRMRIQPDDGFGVAGFRCILEVRLDPYARGRLADALGAALVPWNRAVMRDGRPYALIGLEVRRPVGGTPFLG
ncbi:MAG: hypothetical protein ACM3ST_13955 [Bdellovibrio bacteriovorus]